ncbi:LacI family DNA-binding transcriptional regulator [Microbacterium sp. MPKO10]|uniref:LacI family DNA-binding transcriptional regulator n=1 Tax=Microbacterium sp. MPKO10 TaxID=2989818 RepID=UPI0022355AB6|nr:LacI family DNA-binding transcriptional regulator [Microbacterium sp. MPKO10]MCW4460065.1 LacI family transcriptional regulator [Microbacterium sp. MPKO10]
MSKPVESNATILDVARRAGVSRTTVSRVLNEPDRVSKDTLQRVQEAATALNYSPNSFARGLRSGRTDVIALLVGDISQPFHGSLAQAVVEAAEERGFGVMLYDLGHSTARLEDVLRKLPRQGVDGMIIATADDISTSSISDAVNECLDQGLAIVTGVEQFEVDGITSVLTDYREGTQLAMEALATEGLQRPALLLGDRNGPIGKRLVAGAPHATVYDVGYTFDDVESVVQALTHDHDALIVATLPMALGAMSALTRAGRSLPIIVCEEVPFAAQVTPAFSTSAVPPQETGREMVRLVDAIIGSIPIEPRALHATLTRRESF